MVGYGNMHNNSALIIGSIPDEHGAAEISPERELLTKNESKL